jgi:hypothetical protein
MDEEATEDGEIKRYHFRKRPSSQMENMKRSLCGRKKSKGKKLYIFSNNGFIISAVMY